MTGWPFTSVTTSGTGSTTPSSAGAPWQGELPKYRFPAGESPAENAFQLVADELLLDGNAGRTWRRSARPGRSRRSTG